MMPVPEDDDLVAAEYALGTLDAEERREASRRCETDPDFAGKVAAWTARLEPLSEAAPEMEPGDDLWPRLVRRLGWTTAAAHPAAVVLLLERRLRRWRAGAVAATALAACLAAVTLVAITEQPGEQRPLVAVLQASDAPPAYLIRADLGRRRLAVRSVAAKPPAGKAFELWIIDPSLGDPRSLGVLQDDSTATRSLPAVVTPDVAARATYAITVEPEGGSPDGRPSGAPVFVGHLLAT